MSPQLPLSRLQRTVGDLVFPKHCALCRVHGTALCAECATTLSPPPDPRSDPLLGDLDQIVALFAYEGAGREIIGRLKFHNHRDVISAFGPMLASEFAGTFDVVTWVPTTAQRRRKRGYDQARLIAKAVAGELEIPATSVLRRTTNDRQVGRTRAERFGLSFTATRPCNEKRIVVVDDVRTTGASLVAAAQALRVAGAASVVGGTFAATP